MRAASWTLLGTLDAVRPALARAAKKAGYALGPSGPSGLSIEVPKSLFGRRVAASIVGTFSGSELTWVSTGEAEAANFVVGEVAVKLSAGVVDDHGIAEAARLADAGQFQSLFLPHLISYLEPGERAQWAQAVHSQAGILSFIAVTQTRAVVVGLTRHVESAFEFPLPATVASARTDLDGWNIVFEHADGATLLSLSSQKDYEKLAVALGAAVVEAEIVSAASLRNG